MWRSGLPVLGVPVAMPVLAVTAMTAMHEQVHERAGQEHQERKRRRHMLLVPDHEIAADHCSKSKHAPM